MFGVLTPDGEAVALVKPQFEIGKGLVGKGGVVRDAAHHRTVVSRVARFCVPARLARAGGDAPLHSRVRRATASSSSI